MTNKCMLLRVPPIDCPIGHAGITLIKIIATTLKSTSCRVEPSLDQACSPCRSDSRVTRRIRVSWRSQAKFCKACSPCRSGSLGCCLHRECQSVGDWPSPINKLHVLGGAQVLLLVKKKIHVVACNDCNTAPPACAVGALPMHFK